MPKETQEVINCYETTILFRCRRGVSTKVAVKLEREIFLTGYCKALGYGAGRACYARSATSNSALQGR